MELKNYIKELNKLNNLKGNNTRQRIIKKFLQSDNVKIALYNDVVSTVVNIWNKYENKQLGEKTAKKIKIEIEKIFNNKIFVYPFKNYIYIATRDASGKYKGKTEIEIITNNYKKKMTDNNKILKLNIEDLADYLT